MQMLIHKNDCQQFKFRQLNYKIKLENWYRDNKQHEININIVNNTITLAVKRQKTKNSQQKFKKYYYKNVVNQK